MLRDTPVRGVGTTTGLAARSRLFKSLASSWRHMRVASRQKAISGRPATVFVQRSEHHFGVVEFPDKEMAHADRHLSPSSASLRAEPQRGLETAVRQFGHPNAEADALVVGDIGVAVDHRGLDLRGAVDRKGPLATVPWASPALRSLLSYFLLPLRGG